MAKENKKRKGNLKYSILLLLLIAILLITSTYAWFTSNRQVSIEQLQVRVDAQNGLQISVDAHDWKASVSRNDILAANYAQTRNQMPTTLTAVSTAGKVGSDGLLEMFLGTVSNNKGTQTLVANKETETTQGSNVETGNYIAFDIYLRVDDTSTIVLDGASSKVTFADADEGLQNAARVAFVKEGYVADPAQEATIQTAMEGKSDVDGTTNNVIIWEPNNNTHTDAAVLHANQTYGQEIQTDNAQLPYVGVMAEIEEPGIPLANTDTADDTHFADVTVDQSTSATNATDITFDTLSAGVTKYRVYMWIEGQDYDCENGASGSSITFDLQFKRVEE